MSETKKVLQDLGWSDELIEAFLMQDEIVAIQEPPDFIATADFIDLTEMTISLDESAISVGTDIKIIS